MLKLYTIHYNNYFNRKVLQESTLTDYLVSAYFTSGHVTSNLSFNEGDGITTSQIINYKPAGDDYAILVRETTVDNVTTSEIISRWFILEDNKQRTGQYDLKLQRDVIVDNFKSLYRAPIFVEKGNIGENDDMICNSEGMIFNQIKINEEPLKLHQDDTAWIVGYVTKKDLIETEGTTTTVIDKIIVSPSDIIGDVYTINEISEDTGVPLGQLVSLLNIDTGTVANVSHALSNIEVNYGIKTFALLPIDQWIKTKIELDDLLNEVHIHAESPYDWNDPCLYYDYRTTDVSWGSATGEIWGNSILTTREKEIMISSVQSNTFSQSTYNKLLQFNNKYIIYNNRKYLFSINIVSSQRHEIVVPSSQPQASQLMNAYLNYNPEGTEIYNTGHIYIWSNDLTFGIVLSSVEENGIIIPIASASSRKDCSGSVCDIFAIPFGALKVLKEASTQGELEIDFTCLSDKQLLFKFASTIATKLSSQLYDIQLLPFSPAPIGIETQAGYTGFDTSLLTEGEDFDYIYYLDGTTHVKKSFIYWLNNANFTSQITWNQISNNRKIDSQTKMTRLCSPTGNGMFDFNIAKNNGIHNFTLNMTFKPFSPYIQILPNFSGLYGLNFNDYRGLICSGDFSLSRIEDAWIQFQLNNKNYQNIFNRDVANMDFQFGQQKAKQLLSSGAKIVGGTASGAMAGAKVGGAYGAIAGAVVGAGVSTATVGIDWQMQEEARAETKDYAVDKFNFSLGNIQSQPQSLTKVDSFIINSKLFPFIEFYDCTESEKTALENKIKYNGMTVNRIGTISEFKVAGEEHWFQGQLIRAEIESGNAKMLNACYNELLKGVYI